MLNLKLSRGSTPYLDFSTISSITCGVPWRFIFYVFCPFLPTLIREEPSILAGRTLEEIDAQIARTDSNLPNSLREAVVHECGHARAYKGKTPKEISAMNESLSNRGVDGISPIAEMDGAECIAEIEVMLYRGEQVSDAAMHLYNEFITE